MVTAASPAEILRAVERWARVRGFTLDADPVQHGLPWGFLLRDGEIVVWHWADDPLIEHVRSPALALAWALLVETDVGPVDVGRCPACVARGGPLEWATTRDTERAPFDSWETWDHEAHIVKDYKSSPSSHWPLVRVHVFSRPCPACEGTGRETIHAARLLLDAAPSCSDLDDRNIFERLAAREPLLVHADQLQAVGDPIGELLGWALTLWTGEPNDQVVCPRCDGDGHTSLTIGLFGGRTPNPCTACDGKGRLIGHPHTAEAVRWLEWLTWAREFERERDVFELEDDARAQLAEQWADVHADQRESVARAMRDRW